MVPGLPAKQRLRSLENAQNPKQVLDENQQQPMTWFQMFSLFSEDADFPVVLNVGCGVGVGIFLCFAWLLCLRFCMNVNVHCFSIKERHIAAFFAMKFFFGITTNSDAYDAGRLYFSSTLATYGKISKENKQKVYYMCECQAMWLRSLIPDTEEANVEIAKSSADDSFEGVDDQASGEDSAEDEQEYEEDSAEDEEEDSVIDIDKSLLSVVERSRSVPTTPGDSYTEDSFVVADDEEIMFSYDAKREEPARKKRKRGESPRLPRKSSVSKRGPGRARGTRSGKTTRSKGAQKQGKAKQGKVQQRGKEKKGGTKRKGKMVPRKTQPPRKRTQHQPPEPRASPKQPKRFSFSALRPPKD